MPYLHVLFGSHVNLWPETVKYNEEGKKRLEEPVEFLLNYMARSRPCSSASV